MAVLLGLGGIGILGYNALLRLDTSSGSGAPLPAGFPSDFPIYHPAALEPISHSGSGLLSATANGSPRTR